jgi:hypothetical protein
VFFVGTKAPQGCPAARRKRRRPCARGVAGAAVNAFSAAALIFAAPSPARRTSAGARDAPAGDKIPVYSIIYADICNFIEIGQAELYLPLIGTNLNQFA